MNTFLKFLLLFIVLLTNELKTQSLSTWGIKFGLNQTHITGGSSSTAKIGQSVGFYWRFLTSGKLYVQPELLYCYKRSAIKRPDVDEWNSRRFFHEIHTPVLVGYEIGDKTSVSPVSLAAGFSPVYRVRTGADYTGDRQGEAHTRKTDFELILGVGLRLPFHGNYMTLDGRIGFSQSALFVFSQANDDNSFKTKGYHMTTLSLLLGFPI